MRPPRPARASRTSCSTTTATATSPRWARRPGVADPRGYFGLGIAWFDFNGDGWPDLYVANDSGPNYLYQNQKDGTFKESAFPMGVAVSEDGGEQGSMGVALGDYENVGRLSLYVTNFAEEYNALYHNDGDHFTDVSFRSKTARQQPALRGAGARRSSTTTTTGCSDLIVVNGHVYPQLDRPTLGRPPDTGSASSSTTTAATGRSTRWRPSSGPSSWRSG